MTRPQLDAAQKREQVRVPASLAVTALMRGGGAFSGKTIDISGAGLSIKLKQERLAVPLRTWVELMISLPGDEAVVVDAIVVRRDEPGVYALSFQNIGDRDQERLVRFVFERMRRLVPARPKAAPAPAPPARKRNLWRWRS